MIGDETAVFLADFGVTVVWGARSGKGIFDAPTEIVAGGSVLSNEYQVIVKTADFPNIDNGVNITVAGVSYYVREAMMMDDGLFSTLYLSKN